MITRKRPANIRITLIALIFLLLAAIPGCSFVTPKLPEIDADSMYFIIFTGTNWRHILPTDNRELKNFISGQLSECELLKKYRSQYDVFGFDSYDPPDSITILLTSGKMVSFQCYSVDKSYINYINENGRSSMYLVEDEWLENFTGTIIELAG